MCQTKRNSLRDRVTQDIQQMNHNYGQLRAASQKYVVERAGEHGTHYDPYQDEDTAHQALLNDAASSSTTSSSSAPSSAGLLYQNSEYIGDLDGHLAMLESQASERTKFMHQIEKDVIQVHKLFQDVHFMVNEQQKMVDDIEDQINTTTENTKAGMEQLIQAQQYQAAKRKKMCFLVIMAVIALLLFILFIWVAFGH